MSIEMKGIGDDILKSVLKLQSMEFAQLVFDFALVQYFLTIFLFSNLKWYCKFCAIICWKYVIYIFICIFQQITLHGGGMNFRKDIEIWTSKKLEAILEYRKINWTRCTLYYFMATIISESRNGMQWLVQKWPHRLFSSDVLTTLCVTIRICVFVGVGMD